MLLLLHVILAANTSSAQSKSAAEFQVKAVFLYNFTQFIDWPDAAFKSPDAPFVIGIIGDDPFGSYLDEAVAGEKIGMHPILIKRFNDLRSVAGCHMLYVNATDPELVGR